MPKGAGLHVPGASGSLFSLMHSSNGGSSCSAFEVEYKYCEVSKPLGGPIEVEIDNPSAGVKGNFPRPLNILFAKTRRLCYPVSEFEP